MRAQHAVPAALAVLVACLAGCTLAGDDVADPPSADAEDAEDPPSATPPPPAAAPSAGDAATELPYAARMPPEEEVDAMVLDAADAYLAHRAAYDAAARTGFADAQLLEAALEGTDGSMRDLLERESASLAEAGHVVEGGTEVLGMEVAWLGPPTADGGGLQVVFDACVLVRGVLRAPDGSVARDLTAADAVYVQPRLVHVDGGWVLHEQLQQAGPCPGDLTS
ncbi:hypothetical protein FHE66_11140 [Georgenia sp. 311]|uniref:hypothetical protein n=1 Tax=Georgenia sp. 311 TaxID=2585134 RepID=UPI0011120A02|nr:hypothetical protein [Georgenia sp. 311]TNC17225.1 hypothetical protein FHE66_11140 [Georgenia sp. 311]